MPAWRRDRPRYSTGHVEEEGNANETLPDLVRVPREAMLAEELAVIRRDDDDRS